VNKAVNTCGIYNGVKYIGNLPLTMEDFLKEIGAKVKVFYDVRK
jgi:hypothetical protein